MDLIFVSQVYTRFVHFSHSLSLLKCPNHFTASLIQEKNDSSVIAVWIMLLLRCYQSKKIHKCIRTRIVIVQPNNLQENISMVDFTFVFLPMNYPNIETMHLGLEEYSKHCL